MGCAGAEIVQNALKAAGVLNGIAINKEQCSPLDVQDNWGCLYAIRN
jgi:hypothetical protein